VLSAEELASAQRIYYNTRKDWWNATERGEPGWSITSSYGGRAFTAYGQLLGKSTNPDFGQIYRVGFGASLLDPTNWAAGGLAGRLVGAAERQAAGELTAGAERTMAFSETRAVASEFTEAHSLAPLRAEAAGGQRVWLVGPAGAQSTVGVRYHSGGIVTFDTPIKSGGQAADRYAKAIENHLGLKGASPKQWWSGNHGSPSGAWIPEERFFRQDRGALEGRRGGGWSVRNSYTMGAGRNGPDPPACSVFAWCYSTRNLNP
jgi:hypothetical protein